MYDSRNKILLSMKQLTVDDVRNALYGMLLHRADSMTDEELLLAEFAFDLNMYEQDILLFTENLQRVHHIYLPPEVLQPLEYDNTVQNFLETANRLLQDLDD